LRKANNYQQFKQYKIAVIFQEDFLIFNSKLFTISL
jgi:hypothetical protein